MARMAEGDFNMVRVLLLLRSLQSSLFLLIPPLRLSTAPVMALIVSCCCCSFPSIALSYVPDEELMIREHESQFPPNNHFADDFLRECATYGVETKKRVALLPEARRWFDSEGEAIDTDAEAEAEQEEGEEVEEVVVGRPGIVHGNGHERTEIVQYIESDESDSD
jgi:hypothetical protein